MKLFCPRRHEQTGLPAMGGLCQICITEYPEDFECKNADCADNSKGQHFHPDERSYFVDEYGVKYQ